MWAGSFVVLSSVGVFTKRTQKATKLVFLLLIPMQCIGGPLLLVDSYPTGNNRAEEVIDS